MDSHLLIQQFTKSKTLSSKTGFLANTRWLCYASCTVIIFSIHTVNHQQQHTHKKGWAVQQISSCKNLEERADVLRTTTQPTSVRGDIMQTGRERTLNEGNPLLPTKHMAPIYRSPVRSSAGRMACQPIRSWNTHTLSPALQLLPVAASLAAQSWAANSLLPLTLPARLICPV